MLRGYQEDMIGRVETAWATGQPNIIGVLPTGAGKCLGRGTPVLMYDGSIKAVEDVRVGDLLMGPDSRPRKVLSLARGREKLYEVIPTKGDSYVVNASHILSLKRTAEKANPKYPCQKRAGEVVNISVIDYLASSKWFRHVHKGWRTGVEFQSAEIDGRLPPYLLGVWLGDGTSRDTGITTADPEIETAIREYGAQHDVAVRLVGVTGQAKTWKLTRGNRWKGNPFLEALQRYELLQNKHVPAPYLRNSREVRLDVLAGLIDSDGYLGNGCYDLIFKSDKLAGDVLYLARSLGFAAYSKRCFKRATNSAHAGDFYNRISISGDVSEIPTRLKRHMPAPRAQKKNVLLTGIQLKALGVGDYFGFEIDGDRLFLLGDFTVTHNTMTMSAIAARHANEAGVAIAHRSVLIGQISIALARAGVPHDIIASKAVVRTIVTEHMEELGRSYYVPGHHWKVASVDTLPGRAAALSAWIKQVTIGFTDEAHHVLEDNKWGRECLRFDNPAMRWFLPTATPERGDRKGLGRQADGIADLIVEGPSMRWHIDNGYLTDYIIRAPMPADLDLSDVEIGANGEYNQKQVRRAVKRSTKIIGNVVDTYKMHTPGKLGIAFAVDIEHATALTKEFNDKGVPCELITAEHSEEERRSILRRYRNRETLVLVNVDLFGEGFDLPAIEVVMFVRPTNSYSLYAQQFGRGLRLMIEKAFMAMWESYMPEQRKAIIRKSGKPVAHIHDHVGNVLHFYGPPDKPREWSLERQSARRTTPSDAIPLRVCTNTMCLQPYERFYPRCPYCGMEPPAPPAPTLPQEVDGDLMLYTPEMLRKLFGVEAMEQALELQPNEFCAIPPNIPATAVRAIQARHHQKLQQQAKLRDLMPIVMPPTMEPRAAQRRFFLRYGVDIVQARLLGAKETEELNQQLLDSITRSK